MTSCMALLALASILDCCTVMPGTFLADVRPEASGWLQWRQPSGHNCRLLHVLLLQAPIQPEGRGGSLAAASNVRYARKKPRLCGCAGGVIVAGLQLCFGEFTAPSPKPGRVSHSAGCGLHNQCSGRHPETRAYRGTLTGRVAAVQLLPVSPSQAAGGEAQQEATGTADPGLAGRPTQRGDRSSRRGAVAVDRVPPAVLGLEGVCVGGWVGGGGGEWWRRHLGAGAEWGQLHIRDRFYP